MRDVEQQTTDAIAYVSLLPTRTTKYSTGNEDEERAIMAPSSRTYYFRPGKESPSNRVPIYPEHAEDVPFFRDFERFRVEEARSK